MCIRDSVEIVEAFNAGAPLDERTNIQFGEGGAGTFSDGKLNTGIKMCIRDRRLRCTASPRPCARSAG